MRTLVHLSDIHFGRIDRATLTPLVDTVAQIHPDLVAVSGDLTQRARTREFVEARAFLAQLPSPQIVIPGNHDIPLHNVYQRFVSGLAKYRRNISGELAPFYQDGEIAVIGFNTARSLTWKGGRINAAEAAKAGERLCKIGPAIVKIVVTHHPFELPAGIRARGSLVGRGESAMRILAGCGADIFLSGHLHRTHFADTSVRYRIPGHVALVIQAGTATSTRGRGECNSFNVIRIALPEVSVEHWQWSDRHAAFEIAKIETFRRTGRTWIRTESRSVP